MATKKVGRPSSYKPEYAKMAEKLCFLGATDPDLADAFGVTITTIKNWNLQYPEFLAARKIGKDAADDRVETSLYQRAIGYTFDSEKVFQFQGEIVRAAVKEHVPPDTVAQIFWLKNRRPEQWRDKREIDIHSPVESMSDDELAAAIRAIQPSEAPSVSAHTGNGADKTRH